MHEHGFPQATIEAYRDALTDKCQSDQLPDEILRVIRDPIRKLGPDERFFGPLALLTRHGREPRSLLTGVAAALLSRIPGDTESEELGRLLCESGLAVTLESIDVSIQQSIVEAVGRAMDELRDRYPDTTR